MKERVIIVGFGWVGQANALALSQLGYDVAYFDPAHPIFHHTRFNEAYGKLTRLTQPLERDGEDACYIVAVGDKVSEDGIQDVSLIKNALDSLANTKGTVLLRSTVLPEHLKKLRFDFYVPEFLHEKQAVEDCLSPYLFVVGRHSDKPEPSFFETWRLRSRKIFSGTPEEASYVKYLSNVWNAVRIAFVNEFGDAIAKPTSQEKLHSIERIIDFMFDGRSYMRYGKAFKGHCLPKDTRAFVRSHKDAGNMVSLLAGAYASNAAHQNLEEHHPTLPEWYSGWSDPHVSARMALRAIFYSAKRRLGLVSENQ